MIKEFREAGKKIKDKSYARIQKQLASKLFYRFEIVLILGSIASVILLSFEQLETWRFNLFLFTFFSAFIFTIEYCMRIISAPAIYSHLVSWKARLKYVFSFFGFIDFMAIMPYVLVFWFWGTSLVNLIAVSHILIIFKLVRYSKSFKMLAHVFASVRYELTAAFAAGGIFVCFAAMLMYYIERTAQPEVFRNIGDGFWWAIITFSTVGYGDIYPVTALGKVLAGMLSIVGIGMIALPTGLISSAFLNKLQEQRMQRNQHEQHEKRCPHCGSILSDELDHNQR